MQNTLNFVRNGDTLIVTRLDRCTRKVKDLHQIIETLNNKTEKDILRIMDFQNCTTMTNTDIAIEFDIARSTLLSYV